MTLISRARQRIEGPNVQALSLPHPIRETIMRLKRLLFAASTLFLACGSAAYAAKPTDKGIWLQEAATPVMEQLHWLHNFVSWIILAIVLFVLVLMVYISFRFSEKRNPVPSKTSHNTLIEIVWTVVPVLILLVMVVPSMQLLYMQDRLPETDMTIKVTGNTWNWEYAYPEYEDQVDSFISNPLDKAAAEAAGKPYLLASDAPLVVPVNKKVKVLVTSSNNLHSFAVPAFGVKMDAVPGRINETWFQVTKEGTFYGQCSELCGEGHYYMPIEVQVVSQAQFDRWVSNGGSFTTEVAALGSGDTAAQE